MNLQRRFSFVSLLFIFSLPSLTKSQSDKNDFGGEYSQSLSSNLMEPISPEPSSIDPITIGSKAGTNLSKIAFNYEVPSRLSESIEGNPKAIADYLLINDIDLLEMDNDITASNFMHKSTRATSIWTTVRYVQTYQGIPVYGTDLAVTVNQNDVITIVLGTYMSGLSLDKVSARMTAKNVEDLIANDYVGGDVNKLESYDSDVVIFQSESGESLLAWKIDFSYQEKGVNQSFEVLIKDEDGSFIQETNLRVTASSSGKSGRNGKNLRTRI